MVCPAIPIPLHACCRPATPKPNAKVNPRQVAEVQVKCDNLRLINNYLIECAMNYLLLDNYVFIATVFIMSLVTLSGNST